MPQVLVVPAGVTLGQDDMAGSVPVAIASDQTAVPVTVDTLLAKLIGEDAVTGQQGIIALAEQQTTPVFRDESDGRYLPLAIDDYGRLHVKLPVDADYGTHVFAGIRGSDGDGGYGEAYVMNGTLMVSLGGASVTVSAHDVYSFDQTDAIISGGAGVTPKFAAIAAASSGNNTLVAAVSDKKIRVLALTLSASAAVNAKLQSAASGTDITGLYYLAANGGVVLPYNKLGWFQTAASALLNLNLSAAVAVGGCLTYIEVA